MEGQRDEGRQTGPFSSSFHPDPVTQTTGRAATYRPQYRSEGIHLRRGQIDQFGVEKTDIVVPSMDTGFG